MAVKAVVLDLHGTLIHADGSPVAGIMEMIEGLRGTGIAIAVASNREGARDQLKHAGLTADFVLDRHLVGGKKKGSPVWVEKACEHFDLKTNELVWLGDSALDMRSAVNGRVMYFNAGWSSPSYPYGINVSSPNLFKVIVTECFAKPKNWYWLLSINDARGRPVKVRAMVDGNGAGIPELKNDLLSFLKYGGDPIVGPFKVRELIMLHLIGSIYSEGLLLEAETWTVYPGSKGGPNKAMGPFLKLAARLFREQYVEDLLIRHSQSIDSGDARRKGSGHEVGFTNQANTVNVNSTHRNRVEGKHIVVVDDFTSWGYSFECARNLLFGSGASAVTCVAVGKYGRTHYVVTPLKGYAWDCFSPINHKLSKFQLYPDTSGLFDQAALTLVKQSYERVSQL